MLKLEDKWIWDFWLTEKGNEYHIFYLQAPNSLGDERLRHHNATIGHSVSTDLINWRVLPDALKPSKNESWDDLATWTGSVIKKDDIWYMFYTAVSKSEMGLIQRIGFATSDDLIKWIKYEKNPVISADSKWYEMLDLNSWHDHAWRDPYVVQYKDEYYAFITARVNFGPPDERGVIALAKSSDLLNWTVLPPVSSPGSFGQMEVPQYFSLKYDHFILFSSAVETTSAKRKRNSSSSQIKTGTYFLKSKFFNNSYTLTDNSILSGDDNGSFYSGKIIKRGNDLLLLQFHNYDSDFNFLGFIDDPIKIDPELFQSK